MNNITFLTEDQIFGNNKLEIFEKIGTKASITDFSILLGGYVSDNYHTNEGNSLENRTGWYWTKTDDGDNDARAVVDNGCRNSIAPSVYVLLEPAPLYRTHRS